MKIKEMIEKLYGHEISKQDALKGKQTLEFTIEEIGFTVENNHGYLKLKLPYQYSKIEGIVKKGNKVYVTFI